jgi:hypothetical protein
MRLSAAGGWLRLRSQRQRNCFEQSRCPLDPLSAAWKRRLRRDLAGAGACGGAQSGGGCDVRARIWGQLDPSV